MIKLLTCLLGSAGLAGLVPVVAHAEPVNHPAEGGIGEIVVTAQKKAENAQTTPIAITAYSGDSLTALGISSVADVASVTPTLYSAPYPNSPTTMQLYMRGQGVNNPLQMTKDGAVGMYLDGFYLSRPQSATMDMADIERIEVLRGPQGTLYGRNTTGGAVNIITRKPTGEAGLRQSLTLGNRNHIRAITNVDAPAIGPLAVKATALYSRTDGWTQNAAGEDYGLREQTAGQVGARLALSERLTVDYSFDIGRVYSTPLFFWNTALTGVLPGYVVDRERIHRGVNLDKSRMDFNGHALTVEWEASDALTVRSLSGYRRIEAQMTQYYLDNFSSPSTGQIINIRPVDDLQTRQYSQEFQAVGEMGERIDFVAGLYYFRETGKHAQDTITALSLLSGTPTGTVRTERMVRMTAESKAAYAQATYTPAILSDRLDLTVGLRYTDDKRRAARDLRSLFSLPSGASFPARPTEIDVTNRQSFSKFNTAVTVNFRAGSDLTLYAKFANGYRAGGSDESALFFTETFAPETVSNFEAGLKSDWFDRRLRLNLAGFVMNYRNIQLDMPLRRNDPTVNQTINAGKARIAGIEADLTIAPVRDLLLTASYAFLDTKITEIAARAGTVLDPAVNPDSGFTIGENVASRFTLAYAPRHAVSASADYTLLRWGNAKAVAHANYQWKDQVFASSPAGPAIAGRQFWAIPAYGTLDARFMVSWETASGSEASVALWGRNITDRTYKATVAASGSPATGFNGQSFAYGEPATYGVELSYRF